MMLMKYHLSDLKATHPHTTGLPQEIVLPLFDAFGRHIVAKYGADKAKARYTELDDKLFTETVGDNVFISSLEISLTDEETRKFPHLGSLPLDELKNSARKKLSRIGTHNLPGQMFNFYFNK